VLLLSGLTLMIALSRAGSRLFWKVSPAVPGSRHGALALAPPVVLLAACLLLALAAAPVVRFAQAAAGQLLAPAAYVTAVLGTTPVQRSGP
jgi:multicomponent K+:H+ antiporter subunit D